MSSRDQHRQPSKPNDKEFRQELEALILRWAGEDPAEQVRRWGQVKRWSRTEERGSAKGRDQLRETKFTEQGRACPDCQRVFDSSKGLHVHRLDKRLSAEPHRGYIPENVVVLCSLCHERRESEEHN